ALVKELGIWGAMTVQTIVDARDGIPRLMEINPRLGNNLWLRTELGINEPLMYLRLAQGQAVDKAPSFPEGILCLDPLWDALYLHSLIMNRARRWWRARSSHAGSTESTFVGEPIPQLLRALKSEYFGATRRVSNPLNRGYWSDPLPPLIRIGRTILFEMIRRRVVSRKEKSLKLRPQNTRVESGTR
ncbi:MAG: hypothetical protein ACREB3_09785, partial [Burkholderiales bacterium]